jgi:hypothetical protein
MSVGPIVKAPRAWPKCDQEPLVSPYRSRRGPLAWSGPVTSDPINSVDLCCLHSVGNPAQKGLADESQAGQE